MKIWKRVLSIALAYSLALGLCACNKEGGLFGGSDKKEVSANASLAKEYVYRMDELDFSALQTKEVSDCSVQKIMNSGDQFYFLFSIYQNDGTNSYKLMSVKEDGSAPLSYELQTSLNESATPVQLRTEEGGVDNDMSLDQDFYSNYVYEYTDFSNFTMSGDKIYANKTYYYEDYSDFENAVNIQKNYVCCWDLKGNMQWETAVDLLSDADAWYYIDAMAIQPDGKVAMLISGDQNGQIIVDDKGNVTDLQQVDILKNYFNNSAYSVAMSDGRMLVSYYDSNWTEMTVGTYDFNTKTLNDTYVVPGTIAYNGLSNLNVDANGDLVYINNQGVFKYHKGDAEPTQMMSFVNSDINVSYLDAFAWVDDEHFVGVYSVYNEVTYKRTLEGGIFTKVAPEDIPDKEVLVLGGNYISSEIKARVVNYNKNNNAYRIVIKDYSQYNTSNDYMAGYTQMNNDIIAGNMPDILIVDSYNMSIENYVSKGLLADVGELLANDPELANEEYMNNVFEACKIDGKLYEVIPSFSVSTYIGKTSLVGSRTSWTMKDAQELMAQMPEGTSLFGNMTRDSFFYSVMQMSGRNFVNVSTGECKFNSEEFISLMEFAMTLPEEIIYDYTSENWYTDYENQYRENRTVLSACYISNMQNLVYTINGSFGEPVTFVGMPTSSGQGSVIYTSSSYAISAKSAHVDEAWNFVKYYLTDEYQETISWQLPVKKLQFDILAQKATKNPTYFDGNGTEVEDGYYYWINDENIALNPLTLRQVYDITNYISGVTQRAYYNTQIENIITEEMAAYYSGQKSSKEVAEIIQSRVQLYVNENR